MELNSQSTPRQEPNDEEEVVLVRHLEDVGSSSGANQALKLGADKAAYLLGLVDVQKLVMKMVAGDSGDLNVSNLQVPALEATNFWYKPDLMARSLTIGTQGGHAKLDGKWDYLYKKLCTPLRGNGDFSLEAANLTFQIALTVENILSGSPTVRAKSCDLNLDTMDLKIRGGGILGFLLNLFTAPIERKVRTLLQKDLCEEIMELLNDVVFTKVIQELKEFVQS